MKPTIRSATADDLDEIIRLGERLRLSAPVWFPACEREYFRLRLDVMLSDPQNYCCFVAQNGSKLVGLLNGLITSYEWSAFRLAAQRVFYVEPGFRSLALARGLLSAYVSWAERLGVTRVLVGLGNGLNPEKVDRFYRRMGFHPIGGQYLRDSWASKPSQP